jgi:hypothetical protein
MIFHIHLSSQVQDLTKCHKCTEKVKHNLANVLQNIPPVNIPYIMSLTILNCNCAGMLMILISENGCKLASIYILSMSVLYYSVIFIVPVILTLRTVTEFHNARARAHTHTQWFTNVDSVHQSDKLY